MTRATRPWLGLIGFVAASFAAAAIGSAATYPNVDTWYAALAKPSFTPPDWVFGPVWTVLFLMMALAGWLVWRGHGLERARLALGLFAVQLALNALWSILFFGLRSPGLAMIEIAALWGAILATILAFRARSVPAAWLLVPYFAWVSFAAVLNFNIWRLNA